MVSGYIWSQKYSNILYRNKSIQNISGKPIEIVDIVNNNHVLWCAVYNDI